MKVSNYNPSKSLQVEELTDTPPYLKSDFPAGHFVPIKGKFWRGGGRMLRSPRRERQGLSNWQVPT